MGPSSKAQPQRANTQSGRVVVFVDYQNMYRSARDAFGWQSESGRFGNFRPYSLGRQMIRHLGGGVLSQVRVYTGIHAPRRDATQHAHMERRMSASIADADTPEKVEVLPRPLQYTTKGAREKGVDVELAIDLVSLALDDAFDVAVIASADTDLLPAIRFVADRSSEKKLVSVAWASEPGQEGRAPAPLDLAGASIRRFAIPKRDFDRIADKRDFYISAADRSAALDRERWEQIMQRSRDT